MRRLEYNMIRLNPRVDPDTIPDPPQPISRPGVEIHEPEPVSPTEIAGFFAS